MPAKDFFEKDFPKKDFPKKDFLEQDLYPPIREFLEKQGFAVFSEVNGCDVVAAMGERRIIVELKTSFQLKLIYQAIERQAIAEEVYVAIPRPISENSKQWKSMLKLLKRLQLGLITVAMDSPLLTVDVILTPQESLARKNAKKRAKLSAELSGRTIDQNMGGMCRKKIITAYKEKAIELCCVLSILGDTPVSVLRDLNFDDKQIRMLGNNVYGWFYRPKRGIYALSPLGEEMLIQYQEDFPKLIIYYNQKWNLILNKEIKSKD